MEQRIIPSHFFSKTLEKKITGKCDDPSRSFCQQLQQKAIRLQGFPLVLQLLAFQFVSTLLSKIHNASDPHTFFEKSFVGFLKPTALILNNVFDVENDPNVCVPAVFFFVLFNWIKLLKFLPMQLCMVAYVIQLDQLPQEGWGE